MIEYKGAVYISTATEGIYSTPKTSNRTVSETQIRLYPNPSTGLVNYCIDLPSYADYEISVIDITGKVIRRKKINTVPGSTYCDDEELQQIGEYIFMCTTPKNKEILLGNFTIVK